MSHLPKREATIGEIATITFVFAGLSLWTSIRSVVSDFPVPGFDDRGLLGLIGLELFASAVALSILYLRGWRESTFRFEVSIRLTLWGIALFVAASALHAIYAVVARDLVPGAEVIQRIAAASSLSWSVIILLSLVNGVYEEYFLLHYLVEANAHHGISFALGFSVLIRMGYHFYQGPSGAVSVLVWGIVISLFYWRFRRVWPAMVAHILADFAALSQMVK